MLPKGPYAFRKEWCRYLIVSISAHRSWCDVDEGDMDSSWSTSRVW